MKEQERISEALSEIKLSEAEELSYKHDVDLTRVEEGL